jgi:hypothetical protein
MEMGKEAETDEEGGTAELTEEEAEVSPVQRLSEPVFD